MSTPPPLTPLSPVILTHIILAVLTWAILAPLPHLLSPLSRLYNQPHRAFLHHRLLMLLTLVSTLLLSLLALFFSQTLAPPTHRYLAFTLLLLTSFQATLGALRPAKTRNYRYIWRFAHRLIGTSVLLLGAYIVHHAFDVFRLSTRAKHVVDIVLALMYTAVLLAHLVASFASDPTNQDPHLRDEERGELLPTSDPTLPKSHPQSTPDSPQLPPVQPPPLVPRVDVR